jgi:hypothetical protein
MGSSKRVDKSQMFIDNIPTSPHYGRIYVVWTKNIPRVIQLSRSDDGTTWSTPKTISSGVSDDHGPSVSVGGTNGAVYVAWCTNGFPFSSGGCSGSEGELIEMVVTSSTDGGATWSTPVAATTSFGGGPGKLDGATETHEFPSISVNQVNGHVRLVFPYWNGSDSDVMFTRSLDGGQTWSTPILVGTNPNDQFFPWMVASPVSSDTWVCYYDEGWNHGLLDVSCSETTDGTSFDPPVRVTSVSSPLPSFAGDYIGADFDKYNGVYLAWADFRSSSNGDIYEGSF